MANMLADQVGLGLSLEIAPSAPGQDNIWARLTGIRVGLYLLLPKAGIACRSDSANWPAGGWLWNRTATTSPRQDFKAWPLMLSSWSWTPGTLPTARRSPSMQGCRVADRCYRAAGV